MSLYRERKPAKVNSIEQLCFIMDFHILDLTLRLGISHAIWEHLIPQ